MYGLNYSYLILIIDAQLYGFNYFFHSVIFNISNLQLYSIKYSYLILIFLSRPIQSIDGTLTDTTALVRMDLRITAMRGYSRHPRIPELEPRHQMQFRTSFLMRVLPLSKRYRECILNLADRVTDNLNNYMVSSN